jgi:hypothetical protein
MVEYETASPEAKAQYDDQISRHGRITNMKKTLLHSLPGFHALMEWYPLRDEAAKFLSDREINFYCYAISLQNDCLICSRFFSKILKDQDIDFDTFAFTSREELLNAYGRALVNNPSNIPDTLFAQLGELFNEEQIVLLTAFGSIMIATNLINTALSVKLDDYLLGY